MKNNNPDRGLLLISLLVTVLATIIAGLILSADSTDPIKTVMLFVQDGFTVSPDTGGQFLENGSTTEQQFIEPPPPPAAETSDEIPAPVETTVSPVDTVKPPETTRPEDTTRPSSTSRPEATTRPNVTTRPVETTRPPETTKPETTPPETQPIVSDEEYFSSSLFIGDSRTAGFYLYAKIPNATYFGATSMSVYSAFGSKTISETGSTKGQNLVTALSEKQYKQIYIMLGINEIGSDPGNIASNYLKLINSIKQYQPEAKIIIQSNMHVTKKKSDSSPKTFSNSRIDALNGKLAALADGKTVFYLGFEEIFDDSTGAMDPTYSGDGVHLKASCYKKWRDWIKENGKIY